MGLSPYIHGHFQQFVHSLDEFLDGVVDRGWIEVSEQILDFNREIQQSLAVGRGQQRPGREMWFLAYGVIWLITRPRNCYPTLRAVALVGARGIFADGGTVTLMLARTALIHIFAHCVDWAIGGSRSRFPASATDARIAAHLVDAVRGPVALVLPRGAFIHILTRVLTLISKRFCPRKELISQVADAVVAPL